MEDKVKLIIEIPKYLYKDLKSGKIYSSLCEAPQGLVEGIRNGIPLDNVKAEIEALQGERYYFGFDTCKNEVLKIIDKHISGEGDK